MPSLAARPSSPGVERNAEKGRPRNAGDAVGAAGQALPVDDDEADDFAERQRDDGEIVAAQPQHRKSEHHAPECGEDAGQRQADPERQPEIGRQQRVGIGADRVKGDVAEIEQAGEADHDVQSPSQHHIGQHENAEIEDVALIVENHRHQEGEDQKQRRDRAPRDCERALHGRRNEPDRCQPAPTIAAAIRRRCCRRTRWRPWRRDRRTGSSRSTARSARPRCGCRSSARTAPAPPAR